MPDDMTQLQLDAFHILKSEPAFQYVNVILSRPRSAEEATMIQSELQNALACLSLTNGKGGLAVVVMMPEADAPEAEAPGPMLEAVLTIRVLEIPLFNEGPTGTKITGEACALNVLSALHYFNNGNAAVMVDKRPIRALDLEDAPVAYDVILRQRLNMPRQLRALAPSIAINAGVASLACGTAGAEIYYTLDGSTPCASNAPAVLLYAEPFAVASGQLIRARSTFAGLLGSFISAKFTP
jgi:hypothetical protein